MNNIKIINPSSLVKAISKCNEGLFGNISSADFEIEFQDIKPIEGYTSPINKETGEQFPNCCPWHKSTYDITVKWFITFPNCCPYHKKLSIKPWFNKSNYMDVSSKVVKQLSYTEFCITENINNPDWHDAITEYIDWNKTSFGQLPDGNGTPVGLEIYLYSLIEYIKNIEKKIPKEKGEKLVGFIEGYFKPDENKHTDLNILNTTYQKWLKIFPFELSFFSQLKEHFNKQLPILNEQPKINRYTNIASAKTHTKGSLIDVLVKLTNTLLTEINSLVLYNNGILLESQTTKLELILQERKLKLNQGYDSKAQDEEQRYRKMLKDWFKDEKRFIDEITPLLEVMQEQKKLINDHQNVSIERNEKNPDSRYYRILQSLKNIVDSDKAFNPVYNEDKQSYHLPYLFENYKNEINPGIIISEIYEGIKKVLADNLFKPTEILLLIEDLMPSIYDYGKKSKSELGFKCAKIRSDSPIYYEYSKTIEALNEIKDVLQSKLIVLYKNLQRAVEYNLKFNGLEKIKEELFKSYSSIIEARFSLMKAAFESALIGSIDPIVLIKYEIQNVENIIQKGENSDIILKDQSVLFQLNPAKINIIYHKLVRGLESVLVEEYVSDLARNDYDDLINTKAILKYKEFLTGLKPEKTVKENETKPDGKLSKNKFHQSKQKQSFNDFFKKDVDVRTINKIKSEFNSYDGKKMAILIYLLQSVYEVILLVPRSKTQSRKHFIKLLNENINKNNLYAVDKVFVTGTDKLNLSIKDADLIQIKDKINKII